MGLVVVPRDIFAKAQNLVTAVQRMDIGEFSDTLWGLQIFHD